MEGLHVLWTSLSNRTFRNELFHCKWVVYEVGKDYRDPGLVKDGTPCGDNSVGKGGGGGGSGGGGCSGGSDDGFLEL